MARDAPEVVVRNIIRDNWNTANTSGETFNVHHGWIDIEGDSLEVTVSDPNDSAVTDTSGYAGINVNGSPSQDYQGTVSVNVWADRTRTTQNPRKMAWEGREEVQRIIQTNHDAPGYDPINIADLGAQRFVEGADDPGEVTIWRYMITVGFAYHVRPPTE